MTYQQFRVPCVWSVTRKLHLQAHGVMVEIEGRSRLWVNGLTTFALLARLTGFSIHDCVSDSLRWRA